MVQLPRPFVYISALMRTGSTVLSEALTCLPYAFIFHEPHLGKNTFSLQDNDRRHLQEHGVDMAAFLRLRRPLAFLFRRLRWSGRFQDFMVREVKGALQARFAAAGIQQMGVKEIKHEGWQHYVRHFPEMKVIMIGRDPRDLYISAFKKWELGTTLWKGPFCPATVAGELNAQFSRQLALRSVTDCLAVRYEELCTDPALVDRVNAFAESPIPERGQIGAFVRTHPKRVHEYELHGGRITALRINRWQREKDEQLVADAIATFDLMPEYVAFWGYER